MDAIGRCDYVGFTYRYHYRSAAIPIYKILDRGSWGVGGSILGNEFWMRNCFVPSITRIESEAQFYSTEWYVANCANPSAPVSIQALMATAASLKRKCRAVIRRRSVLRSASRMVITSATGYHKGRVCRPRELQHQRHGTCLECRCRRHRSHRIAGAPDNLRVPSTGNESGADKADSYYFVHSK